MIAAIQSCEKPYDYAMSMSKEEQAEVMVGTWVLTRAGTAAPSPDETGEEHIQDNSVTLLQYVEITGADITFHFSKPVPVYFQGKATDYCPEMHEETTTLKLRHDIGSIPNLTAIDPEGAGNFSFCYSEDDETGANEFTFYTKDDVHAVRMILSFYIDGYYFEFERE